MASGLIIGATGATLAVKLAGDGVGDVGELLLLLLEILGGSSGGWEKKIVSISSSCVKGDRNEAYHSPRASPEPP